MLNRHGSGTGPSITGKLNDFIASKDWKKIFTSAGKSAVLRVTTVS